MSTATITDPPQQPPSSTSGDLTAGCTTAVPGKHGNVPVDACNSYYNFNPSFAPAVAVAVLFGILLTAHVIEAFAFRKRYCWVVIMGAAWETIAFILHARGSRDQQNIGYATAYQLLYLLAPLWINAFVYMTFARLVHYFLPEKAVWHMKAVGLAKWFVWADVISFVVQAVGGIMASPTASPEVIKAGINVYMGGMGLQQFFILCFVGLMVVFQRRITSLEQSGQAIRERPWRPALYALHAVLLCITVRTRSMILPRSTMTIRSLETPGRRRLISSGCLGPDHLPHRRIRGRDQALEPDSVQRRVFLRARRLPDDGCPPHPRHHPPGTHPGRARLELPAPEPEGEEGDQEGEEGGEEGPARREGRTTRLEGQGTRLGRAVRARAGARVRGGHVRAAPSGKPASSPRAFEARLRQSRTSPAAAVRSFPCARARQHRRLLSERTSLGSCHGRISRHREPHCDMRGGDLSDLGTEPCRARQQVPFPPPFSSRAMMNFLFLAALIRSKANRCTWRNRAHSSYGCGSVFLILLYF